MSIAQKYNLRVIEDAAHALPAKYNGRLIGTIGDLTAFSFYSTKNITTAEEECLREIGVDRGGSPLELAWNGSRCLETVFLRGVLVLRGD